MIVPLSFYSRAKLYDIPAEIVLAKKAELAHEKDMRYALERVITALVREVIDLRAKCAELKSSLFDNVNVDRLLNDVVKFTIKEKMLHNEIDRRYTFFYIHSKFRLPADVSLVINEYRDKLDTPYKNFPTALSQCMYELNELRVLYKYLVGMKG